jgi:hypothetical protein
MTTNPNAETRALVEAVNMADYLAEQLERSLAVQREGQLGTAAAALARYQGWRSTLAQNDRSGAP